MYKLLVIPGSHACRSAMLMLEHKRVPYRAVETVTLMHPVAARLHGFSAGGERRTAGTKRPLPLRLGDMLGTVPGLNADGQRVSTNRAIARFLDARHPEPPLLPADPQHRAAVEEAERWANEKLQMAARRVLAGGARDPSFFSDRAADGRLGCLLYHHATTRRLVVPWIGRLSFDAGPNAEREVIAELPGMLDQLDAWIAEGRIGRPEPNVADLMAAPSLALMLYRPDVLPYFAGRPVLKLVDRLLPEPA